MPLLQGGPPAWIWERPKEKLKWEVNASKSSEGSPVFELRVNCGLEIVRMQFFTKEEVQELQSALAAID